MGGNTYIPTDARSLIAALGAVSVVEGPLPAGRLAASEQALRDAIAALGSLPPAPATVRGRLGRTAIRLVNQLAWWQTLQQQRVRQAWNEYERCRSAVPERLSDGGKSYMRTLGWRSLFNFPTGYAISSRELACALDRRGVYVTYKYLYGPGTLFPQPEPPVGENRLADSIRARPLAPGGIEVVYGQGDMFENNTGRYKIGFTMLEVDGLPPEWVRQANGMDEVWCPSAFNRETFRASGVTRPVHVVPLGYNPDRFYRQIGALRFSDRYTFLSVFEWSERKAPEMLLRTFNSTFRAQEPVLLVCKVMNGDPSVDVAQEVRRLGLDPAGGQIHFSVNHDIPPAGMAMLYGAADCFVLPTRGEGWGMPVLEAMACGLPAIATDYSAHREFMHAGNAYPLAVERLVPAVARCGYYHGFRWAEPSVTELGRLLRHVYSNPGEAKVRGLTAAREVRGTWTWDRAAGRIFERLEQINATSERLIR